MPDVNAHNSKMAIDDFPKQIAGIRVVLLLSRSVLGAISLFAVLRILCKVMSRANAF